MSSVRVKTVFHSVELLGQPSDIYEVWNDFEQYPHFMQGVREVRQLDGDHYRWSADFDGLLATWECVITIRIPHQRIAWRMVGDNGASGAVIMECVGPGRTRLTFRITYSDTAPWAMLSEAAVRQRVSGNLRRFKRLFEKPDSILHGAEGRRSAVG